MQIEKVKSNVDENKLANKVQKTWTRLHRNILQPVQTTKLVGSTKHKRMLKA